MNPLQVNPHQLNVGAGGGDFISDTGAHTGSWGRIHCLTAATFTLLTCQNLSLNGTAPPQNLSTMTPPAGTVLYGYFTAITLATGQVIAYSV